MSWTPGVIKLISNFQNNSESPLDGRAVVPSISDLEEIDYPYKGLRVTATDTGKSYICINPADVASNSVSGNPAAVVGTTWQEVITENIVPEYIYDLSDVDLTGGNSPDSGEVLKYDGTNWVASTVGGGDTHLHELDQLEDTSVTSPDDGGLLYWDGSPNYLWKSTQDFTYGTGPNSDTVRMEGAIRVDKMPTAPPKTVQSAKVWSEDVTSYGADYLLSFDGTLANKGYAIPDIETPGSYNAHNPANGNGPYYETDSEFGTKSLSFSTANPTSNGQFLTIPYSSSIQFDGPFTIDFWVRFDAAGLDNDDTNLVQCLFSQQSTQVISSYFVNPFGLYRYGNSYTGGSASHWILFLPNPSSTGLKFQYIVFQPPSVDINSSNFFHVALIRDSSSIIRLFVNNEQLDIDDASNHTFPNYNDDGECTEIINSEQQLFCIGRTLDFTWGTTVNTPTHSKDLNADLDEFRIVKGVADPLFTGVSYTPPSSAYEEISTTHLMAMSSDGATKQLTGLVDTTAQMAGKWGEGSTTSSGTRIITSGMAYSGVAISPNAVGITNESTSLLVEGDLEVYEGDVTVDGSITADSVSGVITASDITATGDLNIGGETELHGDLSLYQDTTLAARIRGNAGTGYAYITFVDVQNNIMLNADTNYGVVVNESGIAGFDFRAESLNSTHMLYVDAATNRIGVKKDDPTSELDVNGTVTATSFVGDGSGLTSLAGMNVVTSSTTAPGSPTEGDQWYDTANNILYVYLKDGADNSAWIDISTAGSAKNITSSSTPPDSPLNGAMWYETTDNIFYIYVKDAAGNSAWLDISTAGNGKIVTSSTAAPSDPIVGAMWYDTNNNILYVYLTDGAGNSAWLDISTAGGAKRVTSSTGAPASPGNGAMWYDTDNNILYFYLTDAAGNSAWVDISTSGGGSGGWTGSESGVVKLTDSADVIELGDAVDASALPTSAPATAGRLWNDSGTLKISS